nr:LacI family DNA-binding transcriptional regulator [Brevibacillus dissolubilis]
MAQLANVSIATVSRVLNNSKPVSPEIREKIMQIVKETGYQPNAIARSLVNKQTLVIGVMIPDIGNDFFSPMVRGIEQVVSQFGYSLFLAITEGKLEKELKYLQLFQEKQIDGVVLSGVQYQEHIRKFAKESGIPLVVVGQEFSAHQIPSVDIDNVKAAYDATRFLLEKGHERIALISAPLIDRSAGRDRYEGFLQAMREAGVAVRDAYLIEGDFSPNSGYESMRQLCGVEVRPTAVFVATDRMAVGALNYLLDHGIGVPEEMSLIGFDDIELASLVRPAMCSVHIEPMQFGSESGKLLLALLKDEMTNTRITIPHRLIIRQTIKTLNK